jgi:hypothetical protein
VKKISQQFRIHPKSWGWRLHPLQIEIFPAKPSSFKIVCFKIMVIDAAKAHIFWISDFGFTDLVY